MAAVQPVGAASTATSPSTVGATGSALGENDFLKILVTQLQNQDPLNPMDGGQFATQLAQFSSLEQLIQMNSAMGQQTAATGQASAASQAALAASLIGHSVEAVGTQIQVAGDANPSINVDVGGTGGTAKVQILDAQGKVLATHDLGTVAGGSQTLTWSNQAGGATELAPGTYSTKVTVTAKDGSAVAVTQYITGKVDGVDMNSNGVVLRIGGMSVPLGSVVSIDPKPAAAAATSSSPQSVEYLKL